MLASIGVTSDLDRRDRALIAFTLLSGGRDHAIASMPIRHVNLDRRTVHFDARDVRTKNRKTFTTHFFPVGADIEAIVVDWITFLTNERGFGPDEPLFPRTRIALDAECRFGAAGLTRAFWKSADPVRRIFRQRFEAAGLRYFNPHSLRTTLARLGEIICKSPEEFKAWSQNLGHDQVLTTFTSYGAVANHRQAEIFAALRNTDGYDTSDGGEPDRETVAKVLEHLRRAAAA